MKLIKVKYKNKWLHPTSQGRAYYLVQAGKAMFVKDNYGVTFLKMKAKPSEQRKNDLSPVMGVDPGMLFTGITILSKKGQINIEYKTNPDRLFGPRSIKARTEVLVFYRRLRRSRKRHRKIRFNNRTGHKMTKTANFYWNRLQYQVVENVKKFHVRTVVWEYVKPKGYGNYKGLTFTNMANKKIIQQLRDMGVNVIIKYGFETQALRLKYYKNHKDDKDHKGGKDDKYDPKLKNKNANSYFAHCVDSFVLANSQLDVGELSRKTYIMEHKPQYSNIFKRNLCWIRSLIGIKKEYYRFKKGGVKEVFTHLSKLRKIRLTVDKSKSNHGPWNYQYTKQVPTHKQKRYIGLNHHTWNDHPEINGKVHVYQEEDGRIRSYVLTIV